MSKNSCISLLLSWHTSHTILIRFHSLFHKFYLMMLNIFFSITIFMNIAIIYEKTFITIKRLFVTNLSHILFTRIRLLSKNLAILPRIRNVLIITIIILISLSILISVKFTRLCFALF